MGALPLDQRIAQTEEKLKRLKAQQQLIDARQKAIQTKRNRANDTRRKVLIGAFMLDQMARDGIDPATLSAGAFAIWLTRDSDRALFNLQSSQPSARSPEADATMHFAKAGSVTPPITAG
jgi:hypothetical protein